MPLRAARCPDDRIYFEKASGAQRGRPQLQARIEYMWEEDMLVVWKLDRLVGSLSS